MRVVGAILVVAGALGALAVPLLGFPGAFPILAAVAVLLWFVGTGAAAACVAPARVLPGIAALMAALLGWPLMLIYGLAPLWGVLVAACGILVTGIFPRGRGSRSGGGDVRP
jgi:hypothetical protein